MIAIANNNIHHPIQVGTYVEVVDDNGSIIKGTIKSRHYDSNTNVHVYIIWLSCGGMFTIDSATCEFLINDGGEI